QPRDQESHALPTEPAGLPTFIAHNRQYGVGGGGAWQQVTEHGELYPLSHTSYPELKRIPVRHFNLNGPCLCGLVMFYQTALLSLGEPEQDLSPYCRQTYCLLVNSFQLL
uniref:Uncharacterized protein n=1 Tax=Ursus maritimus TaxID=29073 RepID=A0A452UBD1_URSMA